MDLEEKRPFRLSSLPAWVPAGAILMSFVVVVLGIAGTLVYIASYIERASDPVDPAVIDAKFPQVNEETLNRLLLRLDGIKKSTTFNTEDTSTEGNDLNDEATAVEESIGIDEDPIVIIEKPLDQLPVVPSVEPPTSEQPLAQETPVEQPPITE